MPKTKVYRIGKTSKGKILTGKPRIVKAKAKPKKKKVVEKKAVETKIKYVTRKKRGRRMSLGKWKNLGGNYKDKDKGNLEGFHW